MTSLCETNSVFAEKNPLLNKTVFSHILEFLPLDEIKNCRMICRQWNISAKHVLRKRARMSFSISFRPEDFDFYSEYSETNNPSLPFTAFKFTSIDGGWPVSEVQDFLVTWVDSVKSLDFDKIFLFDDDGKSIRQFDMDPWIDIVAKNLVELKADFSQPTFLSLSLDKLAKVKTISLNNCNVNVNCMSRIAPLNLTLRNPIFRQIGSTKIMKNAILNDFVDFSECSAIDIKGLLDNSKSKCTLDMSRNLSRVLQLKLRDVNMFNCGTSKAEIQYFDLSSRSPFNQLSNLRVKEFYSNKSKINLSTLPKTLEKLTLIVDNIIIEILGQESVDLPNLKYLKMTAESANRYFACEAYSPLSKFANCYNLVALELQGGLFESTYCGVDVSWFPKSVKKLKLTNPAKFTFTSKSPVEMDLLILEECLLTFFNNKGGNDPLMTTIKPNVLVVKIGEDNTKGSPDNFLAFVLKNKQMEKTVVGLPIGLMDKQPFEATKFSKYVDKKSNYYEFKNTDVCCGTAITPEEFESYFDITKTSN